MTTTAIIVAAGRGKRAGGAIPKQYQYLAGRAVLSHCLTTFARATGIDSIVLVIHPDDRQLLADAVEIPRNTPVKIVDGAASRTGSVANGLAALPQGCDKVLIHDGARALVSQKLIDRVIGALSERDAAAPALAVTDAMWRAEHDHVVRTEPRENLFRAQTPQGFRLKPLLAAHSAYNGDAADDVEIATAHGLDVQIVQGDEDNLKLTHPEDFDRARRILETRLDIRTGNGFDVHKFGDGDHVILCGVRIAHDHGLVGHSDADVGMHALTDAIYGALGDGDIGQHFPPSDPQWRGAQSRVFLEHACARARERGFSVSNADCTLICEQPKIGPHSLGMRETVAKFMQIDMDRVSVKATTSEQLGFTGRKEGIAAMATVTLVKS